MRYGGLKAMVAAMVIGDVVTVPAYRHHDTGLRPAPAARAYGRVYGYTLTQDGTGHDQDGKPVAFLRRVA